MLKNKNGVGWGTIAAILIAGAVLLPSTANSQSSFTLSFPSPIWNGTTIVQAQNPFSIDIQLQAPGNYTWNGPLTITADLNGTGMNANTCPQGNQVAVTQSWTSGTASVTIPTTNVLLGQSELVVSVTNSAGSTVYSSAQVTNEVPWVSLNIAAPSTMGVVGRSSTDTLNLTCNVAAQAPPGAPTAFYSVTLSSACLTGSVSGLPTVNGTLSSGQQISLTYPMDSVPVGTYELTASLYADSGGSCLATSQCMIARADPTKRPANATDVLANGLLSMNGQTVFPIGIYISSNCTSYLPDSVAAQTTLWAKNPSYYVPVLQMLSSSGIGFVIDYAYFSGGITATTAFLNAVNSCGLHAIYGIDLASSSSEEAAFMSQSPWTSYQSLEIGNISTFMNNPAVAAYYLSDEAYGSRYVQALAVVSGDRPMASTVLRAVQRIQQHGPRQILRRLRRRPVRSDVRPAGHGDGLGLRRHPNSPG